MASRQLQIFFVLGLVGCGSSDSSTSNTDGGVTDGGALGPDVGSLATAPTYYQDVAPILSAKCVTCHSVGNIAPFSLDGPQLAQPQAETIKEVSTARSMPPWPPGPLSPAMLHVRSLSDTELAILSAWAETISRSKGFCREEEQSAAWAGFRPPELSQTAGQASEPWSAC